MSESNKHLSSGLACVLAAVLLCTSGCANYNGNSNSKENGESENDGAIVNPISGYDTNPTDTADTAPQVKPADTSGAAVPGSSETSALSYEAPDLDVSPSDIGLSENVVSRYEKYMNPGSTTEYLLLVSPSHKLTSDYAPTDLTELADTRKDGRATQKMRKNAAMSMEAMFTELRTAGYNDVSITSAYRAYSYQEYLFNMYLEQNNYDYDYVATFSNPPGSSEHQSGLCADLHNLPSADVSFSKKAAYTWLRDNCWKFGYILRYPEDKVDVTGISFEPWHYRYVGRYHAKRIFDEGLCLEEYLELYYPELIEG